MSRISRLYLQDILEACEKVRQYTSGFTLETFAADAKTVDAVVRNLEIIGEAVKNLPEDVRSQRPDIEWKKIARFRDIIVHHYFKVNLPIVWDVVENYVPALRQAASEIETSLSPET